MTKKRNGYWFEQSSLYDPLSDIMLDIGSGDIKDLSNRLGVAYTTLNGWVTTPKLGYLVKLSASLTRSTNLDVLPMEIRKIRPKQVLPQIDSGLCGSKNVSEVLRAYQEIILPYNHRGSLPSIRDAFKRGLKPSIPLTDFREGMEKMGLHVDYLVRLESPSLEKDRVPINRFVHDFVSGLEMYTLDGEVFSKLSEQEKEKLRENIEASRSCFEIILGEVY